MSDYPGAEKLLRSMLTLRGYAVATLTLTNEHAAITLATGEALAGTPREINAQIQALPDKYDMANFRADVRAMQRGEG